MIKNIVLIGHGSHSKKRIIPSIERANIKILDIIRSKDSKLKIKNLIVNNKNTICYVCSPPNTHFSIMNLLVSKNINQIIEKPAFLKKNKFKIIKKKLTNRKSIIFLENLMYLYSKIFTHLVKYWTKNKEKIKDIEINFLIPEFFKIGFRSNNLDKYLVVHDIGIYPISLINILNIKFAEIKVSKVIIKKKIIELKINLKSKKYNININIGQNLKYKNNIILKKINGDQIIFDKIFSGIEIKKKIIFFKKKNANSKVKYINDHDSFLKLFKLKMYQLKNMKNDNLKLIDKNLNLFELIKSKI